jgi:hypothetical protein
MKKYLLFIILAFGARTLPAQTAKKLRSYNAVITEDAITFKGLFNVYKVRDSIFFEIPDSLLKVDVMVINEMVKSAVTASENANMLEPAKLPGENIGSTTVYFEASRSINILVKEMQSKTLSAPKSRIGKALATADAEGILATLPIIARGKNQHSYVVDATGFVNKNKLFAMAPGTSQHVDYVRAYPENVEFGIYRVLNPDFASGASDEVVINTSFIALPRIPMHPRLFDPRVGYFKPSLTPDGIRKYFSDDQQSVETLEFIDRWRMEPKNEDIPKYLRGELVEPAKPIVIYIDPNTPAKWVKYLIMGVNDWQKAFEQAGFKNAIRGEIWPKDKVADMHDARYSFLCYLPSTTANAYGAHISDPRSGEIIQARVGWFHNVQIILDGWYKSQAGALDSNARKLKFDDELMGQLIRFVSSHEIGHTLGLAHNFISSSETPVERMRDRGYLKIHGHTASIMDYARFNFVAQPEDSIPKEELWPHIGEYDRWAIQWGYKYLDAEKLEKDKRIMSKLATDSLDSNPRLTFGNEEFEVFPQYGMLPNDPRVQTESLGDDNMAANTYGIKNFKRVLLGLHKWNYEENGHYEETVLVYNWLFNQYKKFVTQSMAYIGGLQRTYKSETQAGDVYEPTPRAQQQEALIFLHKELFNTPTWLLNPQILNKTVAPESSNDIAKLQLSTLRQLLDVTMFDRLTAGSVRSADTSYAPGEYLHDLHHIFWAGVGRGDPADINLRNLRIAYLNSLGLLLNTSNPKFKESEAWGAVYSDFLTINNEVKSALEGCPEGPERDSLESIQFVIGKIYKLFELHNL